MKAVLVAMGLALLASTAQAEAPPNPHSVAANWPLLENYCLKCHNATDWAGSVAFDTMEPAAVVNNGEIWEKAIRKLRGGLMPPPGSPSRIRPPGRR